MKLCYSFIYHYKTLYWATFSTALDELYLKIVKLERTRREEREQREGRKERKKKKMDRRKVLKKEGGERVR